MRRTTNLLLKLANTMYCSQPITTFVSHLCRGVLATPPFQGMVCTALVVWAFQPSPLGPDQALHEGPSPLECTCSRPVCMSVCVWTHESTSQFKIHTCMHLVVRMFQRIAVGKTSRGDCILTACTDSTIHLLNQTPTQH